MSFTVTLQPSGKTFELDGETPILEAALKQGLVLPYGCRNGACGSCKCRVVSGTTVQGAHQANALTPAEAAQGYGLMCCSLAASDLTIEARVVTAVGDVPIRKLPCRVQAIENLAPDVRLLRLQLPGSERFQYLAGQYVDLLLKDGNRRSYSMAAAPDTIDGVELHVRHIPGGRFTDALFGATEPALKVRDILRLEGPLGTFFLREDSDKPIVLLASGTGFAPIKALVEQARLKAERTRSGGGRMRPMTLYWGGRRPHDLYMDALCRQWASEIEGFRYVPVVSDALPEDDWHGRTGFVHRAVLEDLPDLSGYQVYACGAPIVIDSARKAYVGDCGLPEAEFFADAFTTAADAA
ncbi:MAG: CDP-6-deoxy-delta-3,4-glucoseen reductase [Lautropia sp.]